MKKLYYTNGKLGFDFKDFFITDPYTSTCCRFEVNPMKEYGLTKNFREPFYNGDDVKFNFCKTARKPYDLAVWHLLTFVKMIAPSSINISRDGWFNGRKD